MKLLASVSFYLLIIFSLVNVSLAQDMNPDAGKLYNEGNKLLKAGNFEGAIDNYNKALKIEEDYRIYYQKGVALKKSGKLEESKDSYEACVKLNPDFEAGYNALGGAYFSMGKFPEAIKNFETVLHSSKNNSIKSTVKKNLSLAYAKLGNEAIANGNSKQAIEYLNKAVENNNYDAAYLSLAKLYSELGEDDKCLDAAENALKYRTGISKGGPYYYMGVAYKHKGDSAKAKEMFNQAKADATYRKLVEYELSLLK